MVKVFQILLSAIFFEALLVQTSFAVPQANCVASGGTKICQGFHQRRNRPLTPAQNKTISPEEAKRIYEQEWGYVDKPQSAPPQRPATSTISPDKPLFGKPAQFHPYVPNKIDESKDPITQRRYQEMERMANDPPPVPMPNLTPPPGGDEATLFAPPLLEKIANDKIIRANYGGRFFFTPDGGNANTPWWVVDGYDHEPSPYD